MSAIATLIGNFFGAISAFFGWKDTVAKEANRPDIVKAATAQKEQVAVDAGNKEDAAAIQTRDKAAHDAALKKIREEDAA